MRHALIAAAALLTGCGQPAAVPASPQQAAAEMAEQMAAAQGADVNVNMNGAVVVPGGHPITEAEYAAVRDGMSVQEFLAVVGEGCAEVTAVEAQGVAFVSYACVNADGTSANFSFNGGRLLQKIKNGNLG